MNRDELINHLINLRQATIKAARFNLREEGDRADKESEIILAEFDRLTAQLFEAQRIGCLHGELILTQAMEIERLTKLAQEAGRFGPVDAAERQGE